MLSEIRQRQKYKTQHFRCMWRVHQYNHRVYCAYGWQQCIEHLNITLRKEIKLSPIRNYKYMWKCVGLCELRVFSKLDFWRKRMILKEAQFCIGAEIMLWSGLPCCITCSAQHSPSYHPCMVHKMANSVPLTHDAQSGSIFSHNLCWTVWSPVYWESTGILLLHLSS
jgi:hypothetical protein